MLTAVLLVLGLLIGAYILFRIWDARTLFDRSAFPELFRTLEQTKLKKTFMLVIRFEGVRQWFLLSREPHDNGTTMYLCLPRVGFTDEDYARLEKTFEAHSFEFRTEPEMSRFFAKVPILAAAGSKEASIRGAHAARLFMEATGIEPTTKFRRGYD